MKIDVNENVVYEKAVKRYFEQLQNFRCASKCRVLVIVLEPFKLKKEPFEEAAVNAPDTKKCHATNAGVTTAYALDSACEVKENARIF